MKRTLVGVENFMVGDTEVGDTHEWKAEASQARVTSQLPSDQTALNCHFATQKFAPIAYARVEA